MNFSYSTFIFLVGTLAVALQRFRFKLQQIALYWSNKIKFSQMQNLDVQDNFLLVNKALLVGDIVFQLCYNGAKRCPLFSTFCATKFHLNLRRNQQNIVVAQTIGLKKYRWKIAPNKISLIFFQCSRISPSYVCITFAQYCRRDARKFRVRGWQQKSRLCYLQEVESGNSLRWISSQKLEFQQFHWRNC